MSAVKLKKPEVVESDFLINAGQLRWIRMLVVRAKQAIDSRCPTSTSSRSRPRAS